MAKIDSAELSPNQELSSELILPPVLYHTAPMERHQLIADYGIIPRDDPRNPGGVSGVAQMGDSYKFPGRVYMSIEPHGGFSQDRVVYSVDTSKLDPNLFQVDEDAYPIMSGRNRHRPEFDTPE